MIDGIKPLVPFNENNPFMRLSPPPFALKIILTVGKAYHFLADKIAGYTRRMEVIHREDLDILGSTYLDPDPKKVEEFILKRQQITTTGEFSMKASSFAAPGTTVFEAELLHKVNQNKASYRQKAQDLFSKNSITIVDDPQSLLEISELDAVFFVALLEIIKERKTPIKIDTKDPEFEKNILLDFERLATRDIGRKILLALIRLPRKVYIVPGNKASVSTYDIAFGKPKKIKQGYTYTITLNPILKASITADSVGKQMPFCPPTFLSLAHEALHVLFDSHLSQRMNGCRLGHELFVQQIYCTEFFSTMFPIIWNPTFDNYEEFIVMEGDPRLPFWPSERALYTAYGYPCIRGGHRTLSIESLEKNKHLFKPHNEWNEEERRNLYKLYFVDLISIGAWHDAAKLIPSDFLFRIELLRALQKNTPQALVDFEIKYKKLLDEDPTRIAAMLHIAQIQKLSQAETYLKARMKDKGAEFEATVQDMLKKSPEYYFFQTESLVNTVGSLPLNRASSDGLIMLANLLKMDLDFNHPTLPIIAILYKRAKLANNECALEIIAHAAKEKGIDLSTLDLANITIPRPALTEIESLASYLF